MLLKVYCLQIAVMLDVLQNRCSKKCLNIHRKTPVLESLFNELYEKETPTRVFSCEYYEIFKDSFFTELIGWLFLHIYKGIAKTLRKARSFIF